MTDRHTTFHRTPRPERGAVKTKASVAAGEIPAMLVVIETPGCKGLYREWYWAVCAYQEILFLLRQTCICPPATHTHTDTHTCTASRDTFVLTAVSASSELSRFSTLFLFLFSRLLTALLRLRNTTICQIIFEFTFTEEMFCPKTAHWHCETGSWDCSIQHWHVQDGNFLVMNVSFRPGYSESAQPASRFLSMPTHRTWIIWLDWW